MPQGRVVRDDAAPPFFFQAARPRPARLESCPGRDRRGCGPAGRPEQAYTRLGPTPPNSLAAALTFKYMTSSPVRPCPVPVRVLPVIRPLGFRGDTGRSPARLRQRHRRHVGPAIRRARPCAPARRAAPAESRPPRRPLRPEVLRLPSGPRPCNAPAAPAASAPFQVVRHDRALDRPLGASPPCWPSGILRAVQVLTGTDQNNEIRGDSQMSSPGLRGGEGVAGGEEVSSPNFT